MALANLPEDEERFPVATWVKRLLMEGVQRLMLNSAAMSRPAPPGSPSDLQPDGSNLPWAIEALRGDPRRFDRWVAHVRTALPDVTGIETIEREEDRHRYLRVTYQTGLQAPSWTISDGTLRLLALTLVAYVPARDRIYLIEEPENGIHPPRGSRDTTTVPPSRSPAEVVVPVPEIEAWVWSRSAVVEDVLGWADRRPALLEWLATQQLWPEHAAKPPRPKEALIAALREAGIRRSAALYRELAEGAVLEGCRDDAFRRLSTALATWFPATA